MNGIKKSILLLGAVMVVLTACEKNNDNNETVELGDKSGLLLVTFGSSYEASQETFKKIDNSAKVKFPGEEIRWGYTSDIILNKLRQGNGEGALSGQIIDNDSPEEALEVMIKEGYSKFNVQSLHVIPGEEFDELIETVETVKDKYPGVGIAVGKPLLYSEEDIKKVAAILADKFSSQVAVGPVVFMGHGTPHVNDKKYTELDNELKKLNTNFFVATVEGAVLIDDILPEIEALDLSSKQVTLTPLMSIAGDHANNDMNGVTGETNPDEQSWKERFEAKGYSVNSVMKGLGDYDEIDSIWMAHLEAVKIE